MTSSKRGIISSMKRERTKRWKSTKIVKMPAVDGRKRA
jgi:hypothetical protein